MTTSGLTEKTEAVIKGLVDRSESERRRSTRPSPPPAPPLLRQRRLPWRPSQRPTWLWVRARDDPMRRSSSYPSRRWSRCRKLPMRSLIISLGPEVREKYPIHLGFYLKPAHGK